MTKSIYIGAMTGTSCDAIDISFIAINKSIKLKFFHSAKIPKKTQTEIKDLIATNEISLSNLGRLNKEIGEMYTKAIDKAILLSGISIKDIAGITISGQTVRHEMIKGKGFPLQLGDPSIVAAKINAPVVNKLRGMHIAAGGQGAPLVPEFHSNMFYKRNTKRLILNIGGISNFTYLKNKSEFFGSDAGPGNALLDLYCQKKLDMPFDRNGTIASKGQVIPDELEKLLSLDFFKSPFPKSTGKELFNIDLLSKNLLSSSPKDALATLTELTARSVQLAIGNNNLDPKEIVACGGGVKNKFLMQRISELTSLSVFTTADEGLDPQAIESMAFAWFGYRRIKNIPSLVPTGKNISTKALLGSITKIK